jgi:TonB family protein
MEVGAPNAPASGGGSGNGAGAVISSDPGSKVGLPMSGGGGSLALSPSGGDKPGLGGSGGTTGIGHGTGPGSGVNGEGVGAGKSGAGRGSDPNARDGISPGNGPGGAGNAPNGTPRVPGVSVSGGSSSVTLPSFGSDPAANDPTGPSRTPAKQQAGLNVTVVATANSGGAFEPYRNLLKGEKYTTYLDTAIGPVVMEFADQAATGHPFGGTLTAPTPIRDSLPEGLPKARMVVTTTLDASGNLRSYRVLESASAEMTAKVLAALRTWKFQPAMRGNQPVEVTAIIGFNISTDDRF